MALPSPPTLNRITLKKSLKNLPKSHSFGRVLLPNRSKTQISPSERSIQLASSDTIMPIVQTGTNYTTLSTPSGLPSDTDRATNTFTLSDFWREVQGCNNWEHLLDPLHPLLRREIIRYGEFVTACYKAFDLDPASKRYLNCKYGKKRMLNEVGMGDCGYEVVKYIYATPDIAIQNFSSCGRWIGFVAVSSDEATRRLGRRDIVITFRGTITGQEWVANFMSSLIPAQLDPHNPRPDVKVESGFLSLYTSDEGSTSKFGITSCREQLLSEISRLLKKYEGENISLTVAGHSMGSALALLLAYDVAELGLNKLGNAVSGQKTEIPVTVFSFGGPRVGNLGFKNRCEELGVKVLRIANVNDPITKLPGVVFNDENFRVSSLGFSCYAHVGVELLLDFFSVQNPSCVHDLQSYIGCLLKYSNSDNKEGFGFQIHVDEVMSNLMEKGRELLLSSHQNINVLPGLLSDAGNHHGILGWISRDLMSSLGNELLFGLVLLLL
ncbi:galactolipase DONGLE, chloroplastic-like [Prosopis cineraria]|uniref:galactolipase DONGLE, chloroplastic-like n=1 Tax=Prosopis cineraria TaxID=364024 RepID=UPI002410AF62|nr:galactolipase DONGLE, chloroplastic-like [Prosopis cineraria]XP_054805382.1 galactolipase DONGLE, chloroplastic-like [Prosopis cineraria]